MWPGQIEDYERTAEEDEHFGIDHLKAEQEAHPQLEPHEDID